MSDGYNTAAQMKKIVITGGPCAGKTTALETVQKYFEEKGLIVKCIPETASELIGEGKEPFGDTVTDFHAELVCRQIKKEDAALPCDIMFCDRGALDIKAYLADEQTEQVFACAGYTEDELMARYDAVFHLVTAAVGAEKYYTLANNEARSETAEEAAELDGRSKAAWSGHSRHVVIDNSTGIEEKISRLIKEIEKLF